MLGDRRMQTGLRQKLHCHFLINIVILNQKYFCTTDRRGQLIEIDLRTLHRRACTQVWLLNFKKTVKQAGGRHRLCENTVAEAAGCVFQQGHFVIRSEHDNGRRIFKLSLADFGFDMLRQFEPVHDRHFPVHNEKLIRPLCTVRQRQQIDCSRATDGCGDIEIPGAQMMFQNVERGTLVIHD